MQCHPKRGGHNKSINNQPYGNTVKPQVMIIELQSTEEIEDVFEGARWYEEGAAVGILDEEVDHQVVWDFWAHSDRLLVEVSKKLDEWRTACNLLGLDADKVRRIYAYCTDGKLHYICLKGDYEL